MTGASQNWAIPTDALSVFKAQEKRLTQEERRPRITKASDIMGPGLGPWAVEMVDLDSEAAAFNGMWYVPEGAVGSPDDTKKWMGLTIGHPERGGMQIMWTFEGADAPHVSMQRGFDIAPAGTTRFFSAWTAIGGGGGPDPDPPTVWQSFIEEDPMLFGTNGSTKNAALGTVVGQGKPTFRKITPTLVKLAGYLQHPSDVDYFSTTLMNVCNLPVSHRPADTSNFNRQFFIATTNLRFPAQVVFNAVNGAIEARAESTTTEFAGVYLDGIIIDLKATDV